MSVSYQDLLGSSGEMNEEEWLRYVRQSDFFYQDFDGDGLPELTVNTEGPCVLKYNAGEDRVELHYRKEPGWNLLGTGQMFYDSNYTDDKSDKGRSDCYAYEIAAGGRKKQSITFSDIWSYDGGTDWMDTYKVSVEGLEEIEVREEEYRKLAGAYYRMVSLAPHPMSFLTVFGDGEDSGYVPGKGSKPRYLPEERDFLPINEKSGEEWEAYAAMMKGDFSLVEDERWTSLQSRYEDSLEDGNGTCPWSYFLMDFNQDGRKELCIRYYPDGVNNTAFFRYDKGRIKMWGSYNSADSHGYQLPMRNGDILSVSWYQDDLIRWVKRLDSDCNSTRKWRYHEGGFQDYYRNGQPCGSVIDLSEEEWIEVESMIKEMMIPETAWLPCSQFTPASERPEIPAVGTAAWEIRRLNCYELLHMARMKYGISCKENVMEL